MRDESKDWDVIVSRGVHPIRIATVEAMRWIDEPFSPVDLDRMQDDPPGVETFAYHMRTLASSVPVLCLYGEETTQGATRKLYFFRNSPPASMRRRKAA